MHRSRSSSGGDGVGGGRPTTNTPPPPSTPLQDPAGSRPGSLGSMAHAHSATQGSRTRRGRHMKRTRSVSPRRCRQLPHRSRSGVVDSGSCCVLCGVARAVGSSRSTPPATTPGPDCMASSRTPSQHAHPTQHAGARLQARPEVKNQNWRVRHGQKGGSVHGVAAAVATRAPPPPSCS
jgi:hypothetical protein